LKICKLLPEFDRLKKHPEKFVRFGKWCYNVIREEGGYD
jgi:hypothetical protein